MGNKVYIFDLDGTLIDSMPVVEEIVLGFLDERGIAYPDDFVERLTPLGYKGLAEYIAAHLFLEMSAEQIYAYFGGKTLQRYGEGIPFKEGALEALTWLRAQGARLNVLTASPKILPELCLKRLQAYDLFENVWSIEDFGLTKAQAELYEEAARRLGVSVTECAMVDDNVFVLKTAKAAGMHTIGVYDESGKNEWEETKITAEQCVFSLKELIS